MDRYTIRAVLMAWLVFWILAAVLNSVMDRLENESYHSSDFSGWDREFWYKRDSWDNARKILGYKIDGWHMVKSAMIISLAMAVVTYRPIISWTLGWLPGFYWADVLLAGFAWNIPFSIFYKIWDK